MTRFISPQAPYGSLLKSTEPKQKRKPVKSARNTDEKHLAAVRRLPCLSCDNDPARVAAHLRMSTVGRPNPGIGCKPDDKWTVPLCEDCHTRQDDAQHNVGEETFWRRLGLDPFQICADLYAATPDVRKMRDIIHQAKEGRQ